MAFGTTYPRMGILPKTTGVRLPRTPSYQISPSIPRYPGLPTNLIRGFRLTYVPNYFGIRAMAQHAGVTRALGFKAGAIAGSAKLAAPVATGRYRNSIVAIENRIWALAPYSKFVEFGTSDTPTFAPLRRGADAETFGWKGGGEA